MVSAADVFCPRCKAKPGNPCTKNVMGALMWAATHQERMDDARSVEALERFRKPRRPATKEKR